MWALPVRCYFILLTCTTFLRSSDFLWYCGAITFFVNFCFLLSYIICNLQTIYKISFGQIYLSRPMMTESDGETATLFPKAARLRNLTYSAPLYVDVTKKVIKKGHDCEEVTETQEFPKVFIGKVMCSINELSCLKFVFFWLIQLAFICTLCRFPLCYGLAIAHCIRILKKI